MKYYLLLFFFLIACGSDKVSGTTTTTENSIAKDTTTQYVSGKILTRNGETAAFAKIYVRGDSLAQDAAGVPISVFENSVLADDSGIFRLEKPDFAFTRIEAVLGTEGEKQIYGAQISSDWFEEDSAVLNLKNPASIRGRIENLDSVQNVWVVQQGSSNQTKVDSNGFFSLEGIAPGVVHLNLVFQKKSGDQTNQIRSFGNFILEEGERLLVNTLNFYKTQNPVLYNASPCIDKSDSALISLDNGFRSSDTTLQLYTLLVQQKFVELVHIYPCAGFAEVLDSFPISSVYLLYSIEDTLFVSDPNHDVVYFQNDLSKVFQNRTLPSGFQNLRTLDYDHGTMYSLGGVAGLYTSDVIDPASLDDWTQIDSVKQQPTFFPTDILSVEDNLAIGAATENRYWVWDLKNKNVFQDDVFSDLSGSLRGILLDEQGRIWVMTDQHELVLYELHSGYKITSFFLDLTGLPAGLTRINF